MIFVMKMPKNGVLVNTARKEVIDEEGLKKALEERPDLRYVSDIKFRLLPRNLRSYLHLAYSSHQRKWEHRQLKPTLMPGLLLPNNRLHISKMVGINSK